MVKSYVKTLNTPGAVPSISGAWEQYIGREGHTIYQIANAVYFNEMKERLDKRLPCDSRQILDDHTMILQHVMVNVFEVTVESKGMSADQLAKYAEEFQAEAEDIESSWLQKNNILTENNCETVFKEVKSKILTPAKEIWKEFENQGEAEMRIRNAYESVISEFNRRCRGCKEIIDNLSVLYKEVRSYNINTNIPSLYRA
ncbi:hypothetical protein AC249_AIPGENE19172 [Exaiptasia diaphana]|nr:hypothetical protein AC249_AIPGENE19172 [Exaiptasia diaphana]